MNGITIPKPWLWAVFGSLAVVIIIGATTLYIQSIAADEIKAALSPIRKDIETGELRHLDIVKDVRQGEKEVAVLKESVKGMAADVKQNQGMLNALLLRFNVPVPQEVP